MHLCLERVPFHLYYVTDCDRFIDRMMDLMPPDELAEELVGVIHRRTVDSDKRQKKVLTSRVDDLEDEALLERLDMKPIFLLLEKLYRNSLKVFLRVVCIELPSVYSQTHCYLSHRDSTYVYTVENSRTTVWKSLYVHSPPYPYKFRWVRNRYPVSRIGRLAVRWINTRLTPRSDEECSWSW